MAFDIFNQPVALLWHLLFFTLAIVQDRWFDLGLLWFLVNALVLMFLFRVVYVGSASNRLICWYLYVLSMFTDFISLIVFGDVSAFRTVMAVCVLIVKPIFGFFEWKKLKADGIDVKKGIGSAVSSDPQTYGKVNNGQRISYPGVGDVNASGQSQLSYGRLDAVEELNQTDKPRTSTSPKKT